jgi:WD40 repeat protein
MSGEKDISFDPYHKWLGISKAQRPPTHYQLLGLSQGESDPEVIEEAAIRQISHLRGYQVGPHADDCTRLLNEVSAARQVLIHPQKRSEYDARLAQLAAKRGPIEVAAKGDEAAFANLDDAVLSKPRHDGAKPARSGKQPKRPPKKDEEKKETKGLSRTMVLAAAGGFAAVMIGIASLVAVLIVSAQVRTPPAPPHALDHLPPPDTKPVIAVTNVEPVGAGVGQVRLIQTFRLRSPGRQFQALADGRLIYGGYPTVQQFEPARDIHRPAAEFALTGARGVRFAISPNGDKIHLANPDANRMDTFAYNKSAPIESFPDAGAVCEIALSRDGNTLVAASYAGDVGVWSTITHTKTQQLRSHPQPVRKIVFSRDGALVASMCSEMIQIWNVRESRHVMNKPNHIHATSIEFAPDGKSLLATTHNGVQQGRIERLEWTMAIPGIYVRVAFANDKTLVALASTSISLFDWPSCRLRSRSPVGSSPVNTFSLTPDGRIGFIGHIDEWLVAFATDDTATLVPYHLPPPSETTTPPSVPMPPMPAVATIPEPTPMPVPKPPLETPKVDPPVDARVDPPSEQKFKEIALAVHDAYKPDYARKTPTDRADLAEKLLKLAGESKNEPAERYVLCCEARDLGALSGNWSIVAEALERIEDGFKVDVLPQREAALQTFVKAGLTKESAIEATETALQGVGDAIAADQLALAGKFLSIASLASFKSQSAAHVGLFKKAEAELKLVRLEADAVRKARETLQAMPDDPAANLAVGQYEGLRRRDWPSALPLLAKGGDAELAQLARKDLAGAKDDSNAPKIADEWWALAEKLKPDAVWPRTAFRERAAHWYRQAGAHATGLSLALVTERLKAIEEGPSPFRIGGTALAAQKTLFGHKGNVTTLLFTPDGKRLFSSSLDSTVRSWDLKLAKNLATIPVGNPVHSIALTPSGRHLALGFKDTMKVVEVDNPTVSRGLPIGAALPGSFWVDDDRLFSLDGSKQYIDLISDNQGGGFIPYVVRISAIRGAPTRSRLVTLGEETWIIATNANGNPGARHKAPLDNSTTAVFSPRDGFVAVATADKKIALYNYQDQRVTMTFEGGSVASCLVFMPGGDRLLSGGDDGLVRLWDVNSGKEVRHFANGSKGVTSIALTPDAKQIVTGGSDGVVRVWTLPRDKPPTRSAVSRGPDSLPERLPAVARPTVEMKR